MRVYIFAYNERTQILEITSKPQSNSHSMKLHLTIKLRKLIAIKIDANHQDDSLSIRTDTDSTCMYFFSTLLMNYYVY